MNKARAELKRRRGRNVDPKDCLKIDPSEQPPPPQTTTTTPLSTSRSPCPTALFIASSQHSPLAEATNTDEQPTEEEVNI